MTNNPFPVQNPVPGWINFLGSVSFKREARPCRRQYPAGGINEGLRVSRLRGTHRARCQRHCSRLASAGLTRGPRHPETLASATPPIQGVHVGLAFTAQANTPRPSRWEVHKLPEYKTTRTHLPRGEFARVWEEGAQEGSKAVPAANCRADAGKDINNVVRQERATLDVSLEDSEGCHVPCHTDNSHKPLG